MISLKHQLKLTTVASIVNILRVCSMDMEIQHFIHKRKIVVLVNSKVI